MCGLGAMCKLRGNEGQKQCAARTKSLLFASAKVDNEHVVLASCVSRTEMKGQLEDFILSLPPSPAVSSASPPRYAQGSPPGAACAPRSHPSAPELFVGVVKSV